MLTVYCILDNTDQLQTIGYTSKLTGVFDQHTQARKTKRFGICPLFLVETSEDARILMSAITKLANKHLGTSLIDVDNKGEIPPMFITQQGVLLLELIGEDHIQDLIEQVIHPTASPSLIHNPTGGGLYQLMECIQEK